MLLNFVGEQKSKRLDIIIFILVDIFVSHKSIVS